MQTMPNLSKLVKITRREVFDYKAGTSKKLWFVSGYWCPKNEKPGWYTLAGPFHSHMRLTAKRAALLRVLDLKEWARQVVRTDRTREKRTV